MGYTASDSVALGLPPLYSDDPPSHLWSARDAERLYLPGPPSWLMPLALSFVALNGADMVLTHLILAAGHGVEANPVARLFVGTLWLFFALKIAYPAVIAWRVVRHRERSPHEKAPIRGLAIWTAIFIGVVAWNTHIWMIR